MKVAIFGKLFEEEVNSILNGIDIKWRKENKKFDNKSDFINFCKDADGILTLLSYPVDKEIIDNLPNLKVISNYAVGYNNIDVDYATKKGIIVLNTPDVLTEATAELALTLTFSVARRVREAIHQMDNYTMQPWGPKYLLGVDIVGKTVGIIGAGRIGSAYAKKMKNLGCNVYYNSRTKKEYLEKEGIKYKDLNELLKISDIISIHTPLTEETKNLIDKDKIGLMKDEAILINTSRGDIIDENALIEALKYGKFFGVGLDVYKNEPYVNKELLKFERVLVLPHIGSATIETRKRMAVLSLTSLKYALNSKFDKINNIVNPEVLSNLKK